MIISLSGQFSTYHVHINHPNSLNSLVKISSLKGEVLSIISGAVESCLGSGADRILFDALVEAALASEDLGRMVGFGLGSRMRNFSGLGDDDVDQK